MRKLDVATAEKQRRALQLRNVGVGYDRIADELGYSDKSGAWRAVDAAVKRSVVEPAEHQRVIMAERLDTALQRVMDAILRDNDLDQVVNLIRIEKRRAELFGLDAPKGYQITGADGGPVETDVGTILRERLSAMRERADATPDQVRELSSNGSQEAPEGNQNGSA
jgi:phage-related baseplate assembly protein